jgi:hypothetical protein
MLKHNRMLATIGAATMLATLAGAPAQAAGTGGGTGSGGAGHATFGAGGPAAPEPDPNPAAPAKPGPPCKEMTINGGFETPSLGNKDYKLFNQKAVPAWRTDDPDGKIEIWSGAMGVPARFGKQFAELNATGQGTSIYQDIKTKPNTKIHWSFWIRARDTSDAQDVDATQIHFGKTPKNSGNVNGIGSAFGYSNSSDDVRWKRLYGWYKTGANQTSTRVTLTAVESASTDDGYGNLVDGLTIVENPNCI